MIPHMSSSRKGKLIHGYRNQNSGCFLGKEGVELTERGTRELTRVLRSFYDLIWVVVYTCACNWQTPLNRKDVCISWPLSYTSIN